ncbi:MAG: hypothetical protein OSB41_06420 [Kiritimatiellae bacterium]|nr:hypothetical protein [Kiritimatiellia bacterium]
MFEENDGVDDFEMLDGLDFLGSESGDEADDDTQENTNEFAEFGEFEADEEVELEADVLA